MAKRFNVRVYGLLVNKGKLLLSDEFRMGMRMTKMPGGGVEFGEGVQAALEREWQEELGADIEVGEIFYVNPFLQISAFNSDEEVLAMYFRVALKGQIKVAISNVAFDFDEDGSDKQSFRWKALHELEPTDLTFPIDQAMCRKLKEKLELFT
ncbi:MAG: NUDIX domain-containing protein [Bacteroidia bacterium]|nr:NUDIX domain-containing protein [Bacteroidia bacterium]